MMMMLFECKSKRLDTVTGRLLNKSCIQASQLFPRDFPDRLNGNTARDKPNTSLATLLGWTGLDWT